MKKYSLLSIAALLAALMFAVCKDSDNPSGGHTHTWGDWVVMTSATCEAAGIEIRICTQDAGHTETRVIPKQTGAACDGSHTHTWGAWTVTIPATCASPGLETRVCTQDASHIETNVIPQLSGAACETGGGNLVLGPNEAWVDELTGLTGYVFNSNGTYRAITSTGGNRYSTGNARSYTLSGNNITLSSVSPVPDMTYSYSVTGTTLTLTVITVQGAPAVYVKKSGVTVNIIDGGLGSSTLTCNEGEAWVEDCGSGAPCFGYVFKSNGDMLGLISLDGSGWLIMDSGKWTSAHINSTLTLTYDDGDRDVFVYNVSNGKLTLSGQMVFEKLMWIYPTDGEHTHTWGVWTVVTPATCTAPGVERRICQTDAAHTETRAIPQLTGAQCESGGHTHTWGAWTVVTPATCTAPGVEIRVCQTDATHTETRAIPQLTGSQCETGHTHTWGAWTAVTPATCTAPGVEIRVCQTDATHTETRAIPRLSGSQCGTASKYCDYGFGSCEEIASDSECDTEYGVITAACGSGGTYCDFGQPDQHGAGGCNFAPFSVPSGGYTWTASGPDWSQVLVGRCSNKDDDWGWARVVTEAVCISSNTANPCIADPRKPGDWGGSGPYCTAGNEHDPLLFCAAGEAWVDNYAPGNRDGFIFLANGVVRLIDDYYGYWDAYVSGRWSTNGNVLRITISGQGQQSYIFTYTVSANGNTMTLSQGGGSGTYTKITGVNPAASAPPESMAKPRGAGAGGGAKKLLLSK